MTLVSVIVRSMDRPELREALASLAAQDHPALEVVVVDATGGSHKPLPSFERKPGHSFRLVGAARRLPRPEAADLGLASASGEWVAFLDDDDTCLPDHVSGLVAAASAWPDALVVYGRGRRLDADGRLVRIFGRPFNRALMHFGALFYWQAALIRTRVRDLGCRFDPVFTVCEDRDFMAQVAAHGDFAFAPHLATFNFRPDLGTSGTGVGANRDVARGTRFDNLLRAKWAGPGTWHNERVAVRCRRAVRAFREGDAALAGRIFESVLALYPGDPNAMHGLARVHFAQGDRAKAGELARAALDVNPVSAEYLATLAAITGSAVGSGEAPAPAISRLAACPCGSGRKYKACCGRQVDDPVEPLCDEAQRALGSGDAATAFEILERAARIRCTPRVERLLDTCCAKITEPVAQASLWATAHAACDVTDDAGTCVEFGSPEDVPADGVEGTAPGRALVMSRGNDAAALVRALARLADGWPTAKLGYLTVSV
jgi:glycosyltransferase involved in cell wall biosynthesis